MNTDKQTIQTAIIWTLVFPLLALSPASIDAGEEIHRRDNSPNMVVGVSVGVVNHFGKTSEVDMVSGATTPLPERKRSDMGASTGAFADAGLLRLGHGNLGMGVGFSVSFPDAYFDISMIPRYRLLINTHSAAIPRVEPWIGFLMDFSFEDRFSKDYFFTIGGSLGCDLAIRSTNWTIGLALHLNMINIVPVTKQEMVGDTNHKMEHRMDSVFAVFNFGYRIL